MRIYLYYILSIIYINICIAVVTWWLTIHYYSYVCIVYITYYNYTFTKMWKTAGETFFSWGKSGESRVPHWP